MSVSVIPAQESSHFASHAPIAKLSMAFQRIEATGRRVTISEFTLYRVEDARFAEVWDLTDMDAVMRQIRQGVDGPR